MKINIYKNSKLITTIIWQGILAIVAIALILIQTNLKIAHVLPKEFTLIIIWVICAILVQFGIQFKVIQQ